MFQLKEYIVLGTLCLLNLVQVNAYQCSSYKEVKTRIAGGWVRGTIRKADGGVEYYSFRGLRYGQPPLKYLRFAPLKPVAPWDDVYDAREEGPVCPQKDLYYGRLLKNAQGQSEDCIFVNVHVPATVELPNGCDCGSSTLLPMVVMVNEGGGQAGSGSSDFHGPEFLMRHNVVVVTANTRIGVVGYLSLNTSEVPGNNGLRDWIDVLRWLQINAKCFGGDPNNVTLMGLSTGAVLAHLISISPAATGLFHKLFLSSGLAIDTFYSFSPAYSAKLADELREALPGCSSDPHEFYEQLCEMDLGVLMSGFAEVQLQDVVSFSPVIEEPHDGVEIIIDQDTILSLREGRDSKYPIVIMETNNEMQFIKPLPVVQALPCTLQEDRTAILSNAIKFNLSGDKLKESADKIFCKYINDDYDLNSIINVLTIEYFHYANRKYAQLKAKLGGSPLYMARFSYEADYSVVKEGAYLNASGAVHCDDLPYMFKSYLLGDRDTYPPECRDDQMRDMMTTFLTNFMKCGNPTCTDDLHSNWPAVKLNNIQYLQIVEPYQYNMTHFTPQDLDMIEFYDDIEIRLRDAVNNLICN